ncbi:MAG: hypothetical protein ACLUOS_00610 [Odoribacter splanchnicus]
MENFDGGCIYPVVKVSQYPLPRKMIKRLLRECKQILVLEEGYPVVEEMLKGYPGQDNIMGRLDGTLPRDGELNPDLVGKALCFKTKEGAPVPEIVAPRPPALCTVAAIAMSIKPSTKSSRPMAKDRYFQISAVTPLHFLLSSPSLIGIGLLSRWPKEPVTRIIHGSGGYRRLDSTRSV